ncbi:hypothetical protein ACH5RR_006419 [Cinchona calisaya]|uniref:Ionotropic glutamate receptor C-terminal domain-containing protein n=1 Tax=Cinchona calisaya TaxID=153742 RepID=A0ABD3ANY1_9GENT
MWLGDTLVPPKAWGIPATRTLRVGVPHIKGGFPEFVNVQTDKSTNQSNAPGFSIAIFQASLPLLPFKLNYEFLPCEDDNRTQNGSYYDILVKLHDQEYDFVVGDVTILATRAKIVDFTQPFTESGIVMVVKNKRSRNMWIFLKPLRWDLWLMIVIACIIIGIVLRILGYEETTDTNTITWRQPREQPGLFCWFPITILAFPEIFLESVCLMYNFVIAEEEKIWLVNKRWWIPGVLRPLAFPFEQEVFPFCIPLDRWDKEFYKLQGG